MAEAQAEYVGLTPEAASNALLSVVGMYVGIMADKSRALSLAVAQGNLLQKRVEELSLTLAVANKERADLKTRVFNLEAELRSAGALQVAGPGGEVPRDGGARRDQPGDGQALGQGEQGQEAPPAQEAKGQGG